MTPGTINSGLVQNIPSPTPYVSPSKKDYEILFQPLFNEYFSPPPRTVSPDPEVVTTPRAIDLVMINLSTTVNQEIQSMVDVPIHQEDLAVQRTPLIDPVISMVTEKTASTPTPPITQAHVQMCSTSCWKDISRGV
ncbi:hypothetical protein Tco_1254042 [Tanacetum coccineum]